MKTKTNKQEKKGIEERKFWLAIEELTLLLKENRKDLVYAFRMNKFNNNKDIEILRLELENLNYKLGEIIKKK